MIGYINKLSSTIDSVVCWSTVILTAGFSCLIFASVLSRYFFDFTILFSQEVSKLLFIWACFFAATIAYKRKAHIRFGFVDGYLKPVTLRISDIVIHVFSFVFFLVMFLKSISYVRQIWETYFPLIGISQGWLYVSVVISSAALLIHNLNFLIDSFTLPILNDSSPEQEREGRESC